VPGSRRRPGTQQIKIYGARAHNLKHLDLAIPLRMLVAITGVSNHAADLVQPLENSPYFSQVEFTSPITRDAQNRARFSTHKKILGRAVTEI
jgi:hypothetical protein